MIPRRLFFRVLAATLDGHARAIESRSDYSVRRRGDRAVPGVDRKEPARSALVENMIASSRELARWTGLDDRTKGADVSPELLGVLCAAIVGHVESKSEIAAMVPGGVNWGDLPSIVWRVISQETRGAK
jgi:hypothetical protein